MDGLVIIVIESIKYDWHAVGNLSIGVLLMFYMLFAVTLLAPVEVGILSKSKLSCWLRLFFLKIP